MRGFRDLYGDRLDVFVSGKGNIAIETEYDLCAFSVSIAREIAREILRLTGDGATSEKRRPAVAFVTASGNLVTVQSVFVDADNNLVYHVHFMKHEVVSEKAAIARGWRPLYSVEDGEQ